MKKSVLLSLTALATTLVASIASAQFAPPRHPAGFETYGNPALKWTFPPNRLHLVDRKGFQGNITQEQFNQIIDDVLKYWQPIAKAKGVELSANKGWDDSTVNASAEQRGKNWVVNMYGGLARRPEVTPDGFAMVVCHELGHHFGGYAFYDNSSWAASEGQSDYFATSTCAKTIWARDFSGNMRWRQLSAPPTVQTACGKAWPNNANAQGWCVRTVAAGQSLANLLAALEGAKAPNVDTPDQHVVKRTDVNHPHAQCRLDTYFQAALCTKGWDMNVIPGRGNSAGQQSQAAEAEAMKYSCFTKEGFTQGTRPACWFAPVIK